MLHSYDYNGCDVGSLAALIEQALPAPEGFCWQDGKLGILYSGPLTREQQIDLDALVADSPPADRFAYPHAALVSGPDVPSAGRRAFGSRFGQVPFAVFPFAGSQWLIRFDARFDEPQKLLLRRSLSGILSLD